VWRSGQWLTPVIVGREELDGWPAIVAFSPDDRLLAAPYSRFALQLLRPEDGEPLVRLTSPVADETLDDYAFSRDGRFLAAADARRVHVWDLADLRGRLRELGLDWDDPARQDGSLASFPLALRVPTSLSPPALTLIPYSLGAPARHGSLASFPLALRVPASLTPPGR
jgi:hypothetical protein